MNDYFASSTLSLVLSWLFSIPIFIGMVASIFHVFKKHEDIPWIFSVWIGLCFLLLSPIRYMVFLIVAATSYPFQSVYAFVSIFIYWLEFLVPLVFSLLCAVGFGIPLFLVFWILGFKAQPSRLRYFASAIAAPVVAYVGTMLFSLILPFAALTTHQLRSEDVIRATNGPAYYVFLAQSSGMISLPPYFAETPQTNRDFLRSHVALLYLSDKEHVHFLKMAYPALYAEFHEVVSKL